MTRRKLFAALAAPLVAAALPSRSGQEKLDVVVPVPAYSFTTTWYLNNLSGSKVFHVPVIVSFYVPEGAAWNFNGGMLINTKNIQIALHDPKLDRSTESGLSSR